MVKTYFMIFSRGNIILNQLPWDQIDAVTLLLVPLILVDKLTTVSCGLYMDSLGLLGLHEFLGLHWFLGILLFRSYHLQESCADPPHHWHSASYYVSSPWGGPLCFMLREVDSLSLMIYEADPCAESLGPDSLLKAVACPAHPSLIQMPPDGKSSRMATLAS